MVERGLYKQLPLQPICIITFQLSNRYTPGFGFFFFPWLQKPNIFQSKALIVVIYSKGDSAHSNNASLFPFSRDLLEQTTASDSQEPLRESDSQQGADEETRGCSGGPWKKGMVPWGHPW